MSRVDIDRDIKKSCDKDVNVRIDYRLLRLNDNSLMSCVTRAIS